MFCDGGVRPPIEVMIKFIADHRCAHGVEAICRMLPIAPATHFEHLRSGPTRARQSGRVWPHAEPRPEIQRVFDANVQVCGLRKVCRQLRREAFDVARRPD
jgi:hypothetical protein